MQTKRNKNKLYYPILIITFITGRRPWKLIKQDEHFANEIREVTETIFVDVLKENVKQELYNDNYSAVTNLVTNSTLTLKDHKMELQNKPVIVD